MKKIILCVAAIVVSTSAFADERSQALLSELQKKVASWGDYRVEFSVSLDGQTLAGSYEVSGQRYHIATPDIEIYCDGTTKWEVNIPYGEVAIDRVDPADRTVMGNPTRLFDFLDGSYTHRYTGTALVGGVGCQRVELTETQPTDGGDAPQKIDVFLSTQTGLPVRVAYTIGFMSTEATVDVVRITPNVALDGSLFGYDENRYTGYEIIDFR